MTNRELVSHPGHLSRKAESNSLSAKPLTAVLSTIGKFHTFDLARQLHKRGALETIFSGYPRFKLRKEGIPARSIKTFPYLHAPYMRFAPRWPAARTLWEWQDRVWFDRYVAKHLPDCDIFCGLSGSALHSGEKAKAHGAKYVCDRGSSHIRFQDGIMSEEYDRQGISYSGIDPRVIGREEAEYESADLITVPSTFALNSFIEHGVARKKMKLVPYGVDLSAFYPCAPRNDDAFNVLFVGGLSVRKGVRYLLEAFGKLQCERKRLTLVGSVGTELEATLRQAEGQADIRITGHIPQQQLKEVMSASHVMVLPSVEEGLALVQAQAMACGCPVIATENTGACDLFFDGSEGFIVPIRSADAIAERLQALADDADLRRSMSEAALRRVQSIGGWDRYGDTMYKIFSEAAQS